MDENIKNKIDKDKRENRYTGSIAFLVFIVIAIIIMIGYIYLLEISYSKGNAYFKSLISKVPLTNTSFWKISHLVLFFILGLLFPYSDLIILGIAITWELIEHNLGLTLPKVPVTKNGKVEMVQWWHGSLDDIIIDIFGYYTGKALYFHLKGIEVNMAQLWEIGIH